MEDIWQQFHRLPKAIRDAVASPSALKAVEDLEEQYPDVDVASVVMRVMTKELPVDKLSETIAAEHKLDQSHADALSRALQAQVFADASEYLGLKTDRAKNAPAVTAQPPEPTAPKPKTSPPPNLPIAKPSPGSQLARPVPFVRPAPMPPPPPIVPQPAPSTPLGNVAPTEAYSEEDAKEIESQAARLKNMGDNQTVGFDAMAEKIMQQHSLAYGDELLQKRALTIFKSRLKEIRDSQTTKDMLTREPKVGGLGMDPDMADNVIRSLEEAAKEMKSRGMIAPKPDITPPPPPKIPITPIARPEPRPPLHREPTPTEQQRPVPEAKPQPSTLPPPPLRRPADIPPPTSAPVTPPPTPRPSVQRSRIIDRPAIADITKPKPKTYGPAEEMRTMTLAEFRRLGQGANESSQKVLQKFEHLKDESFTLWAQAIAGWRQSEVHQLYLDMGRQSLEQNQPIKEVISQRGAQNQPYLSEHEFTTLADLNRQLMP